MKKTWRLLALLAAGVMLIASAAGCENNGDSSTTESGEESTVATQEIVDLGGYEFKIGTKWIESFGNTEEGKSDSSDLWVQWKRDFENDFNCTVTVEHIDEYTLFEVMGPRIMSGEYVADLWNCQYMDVEKFRHAGLFYAWQDVPNVDLNQWTSSADKYNTYNGKIYGITAGVNMPNTGVIVNLSMLERLGLDDPFEMVENGTWTLDVMREMAKAATVDNGDGVWDKNDQYGVGLWSNFFTGMLKGNGVNIIENVDGEMQYGLSNPKTVEILTALKAIITEDKSNYPINQDTHAEYMEKFFAGQILFVTAPSNFPTQYPEMQEMEDDYGYLPTPLMEEGVGEYTFFQEHWTACLALPISIPEENLEKVGIMINTMRPVYDATTELFWDEWMRNYRDHEPTIEVLKMLVDNPTGDYYMDQAAVAPAIQMINKVVYDTAAEPASSMESIRVQMEAAVKDYYATDPDVGQA